MSWHYLPELVGESLAPGLWDGAPSAPWRSSLTVGKLSCGGSGTACYPCSLHGTISEPSKVTSGVDAWISSLPDFRANHSALPVADKEKQMSGISGPRPSESFAKYFHASHSWRTCPHFSAIPTSELFSGTWPRAGMMRDGIAYQLAPSAHHKHGSGCSYWPTPTASMAVRGWGFGRLTRGRYRRAVLERARSVGVYPPAELQESIMGWPIGWTALEPLATDKFQQWLEQHGIS